MTWVDRYLGMQFEDGGRGPETVDCWGLVRLIYLNELHIDLPSYGEISADDMLSVTSEIDLGKDGETWQAVEQSDLRPFDVCVMRYLGLRRIGHVGIVTPYLTILHVEHGIDAVHIPLTHSTIKGRIACFRRHRKTVK